VKAPVTDRYSPEVPRHSPLDSSHRVLGAKMVDFGGWEMPLSYPTGVLKEHRTCRTGAVVFDVSHLGTLGVRGPDAYARLQYALTNDLDRIEPGRAQYSHLLDEADGSVVDDVIVWWVAGDEFQVMPNASNTARVVEAVGGEDLTATRAMVAVQGPEARRWLTDVSSEAASVGHFRVKPFSWQGATCLAAGTGYTGEDGVECSVPADVAISFWEALLDAGFMPAGLGARDTLRLEAGLPLHGHELGPGITPLQANLGWVVSWDKGDFVGKAALEAERARGVDRRLVGLEVEGRQPPRAGFKVMDRDGVVGEITSGNYSPMLNRGIALALLRPHLRPGDRVTVDVRGDAVPGRVVKTPFVPKTVR
jgi:aminomethyltransferase